MLSVLYLTSLHINNHVSEASKNGGPKDGLLSSKEKSPIVEATTPLPAGSASERRRSKKNALERKKGITIENVLSEFHLSNDTLRMMMDEMNRAMDRGLKHGLKHSNIAMLPSFVPVLPDGSERGKYLAMDLGGTNLRVMLMDVSPEEGIKTMQRNFRVPNPVMTGTGEMLFDFIVRSLGDFLEEKKLTTSGLSLGFTFSYPCDQISLTSAKLMRWTKGFDASDVEGNDVVQILKDAIIRHGNVNVKISALINDTVGTQVATAHSDLECDIGVIIGTIIPKLQKCFSCSELN